MGVLFGPPCPSADRMVGMVTRMPALGMSRYILVGVGGDCLRRGSSRGAGMSAAGTWITWLVLARMDVAGCPCAWARAADSVSWRSSISSIWTRLVFGSTLLKTRNGRGVRRSGAGRSGWVCVICGRREGCRSSRRYAWYSMSMRCRVPWNPRAYWACAKWAASVMKVCEPSWFCTRVR